MSRPLYPKVKEDGSYDYSRSEVKDVMQNEDRSFVDNSTINHAPIKKTRPTKRRKKGDSE